MSNIADAGFTTNGDEENSEINKKIVDESNVETKLNDPKGDEQKSIVLRKKIVELGGNVEEPGT